MEANFSQVVVCSAYWLSKAPWATEVNHPATMSEVTASVTLGARPRVIMTVSLTMPCEEGTPLRARSRWWANSLRFSQILP